jgi:hypothetical protein
MSINNLNNKFGECCGCPALINVSTYITNYMPSRLQYENDKKKAGIIDSNEYRLYLQTNSTKIMEFNTNVYEKSRCKSNSKNKFYIDSSTYNPYSKLPDPYWGYDTVNDSGSKTFEYARADHIISGKNKKNDKSKF